jgi:hypothetical protein
VRHTGQPRLLAVSVFPSRANVSAYATEPHLVGLKLQSSWSAVQVVVALIPVRWLHWPVCVWLLLLLLPGPFRHVRSHAGGYPILLDDGFI